MGKTHQNSRISIKDEFSQLQKVILGLGCDSGDVPKVEDCYDPKSKEHVMNGTYPKDQDCVEELEALSKIFKKHGVEVLRPQNIEKYNQLFSRDIGFVIEDHFFVANMIEERSKEFEGVKALLKEQFPEIKIVQLPEGARVEGGDVIVHGDYIFVGCTNDKDFGKFKCDRTNESGLKIIQQCFPEKLVVGFALNKSDENPLENALHLDCCFQPIGLGHCIIYTGGFKNEQDVQMLKEIFGEDGFIPVTKEEMYNMFSNIFSISKNVIVAEQGFRRLINVLEQKGYTVEQVKFAEIAKQEGLLRCCTLPLLRSY